ncbi:hypothetical protein CHELA1G11_11368 [Hyphomicrobiales bacterium]|nr:hypothetical protein CHELA1G11_11368 [Hyphomicrobiales bacterium]
MSMTLACEAAFIEKLLLFLRGVAAEQRIAMGEASEADDDRAMFLSERQTLSGAIGLVQGEAVVLVGEFLGMHERQIEELPLYGFDLAVEAAQDGASRHLAGESICREAAGAATEHVARELVEQDNEGKGRLGDRFPGRERTLSGLFVQREEAIADVLVEAQVLDIPTLGSRFEPECQNIPYAGVRHG